MAEKKEMRIENIKKASEILKDGKLDELVKSAGKFESDIKNVKVISSEGMLWRLAKELDADAIVKGYRNQNDYAYELEMAKFNEEHYPLAKTVLLKADPKREKLSSTALREKLARNESIEELIPKAAAELVYKFYK